MLSLKDKLLKAGLVSEDQVKKAEEEKARPPPAPPSDRREMSAPRPARPASSGAPRSDRPSPRARPQADRPEGERPQADRPRPPSRDHAAEARLPKFAPLPGSKEAQRNEAKKQVQLDRYLHDKVLAAQVPIESGATTFYFVTRKGKLRRLDITEAQAKMLEEGKLAVVERPDPDKIEHALVPPEAAAELIAQSEKTVRFWNREGQAVGFLSEAEISQRAAEADEPETAAAPASSAAAAPVQSSESAAPAAETWITIKRA